MSSTHNNKQGTGDLAFIRRVFIVVAVGVLVAAVWALSDILLLLFGSVIVAVMLHALAEPIERRLGIGRQPALVLSGSALVVLLAAAGFFLGPELAAQMRNVLSTVPQVSNGIAEYLQIESLASLMKDGATASTLGNLASRIVAWSSTVVGALASLALVLFGGIYLAANPRLYRDGLV